MISLNQVQLLERKVENAVSKIVALQKQNELLQSKCKDLELKNEQLNEKVFNFEREQNTVEQGILSVLNRLDFVEDSIHTLNSETNNSSSAAILEGTSSEQTYSQESDNSGETAEDFTQPSFDDFSEPAEIQQDAEKPTENGQFDIF